MDSCKLYKPQHIPYPRKITTALRKLYMGTDAELLGIYDVSNEEKLKGDLFVFEHCAIFNKKFATPDKKSCVCIHFEHVQRLHHTEQWLEITGITSHTPFKHHFHLRGEPEAAYRTLTFLQEYAKNNIRDPNLQNLAQARGVDYTLVQSAVAHPSIHNDFNRLFSLPTFSKNTSTQQEAARGLYHVLLHPPFSCALQGRYKSSKEGQLYVSQSSVGYIGGGGKVHSGLVLVIPWHKVKAIVPKGKKDIKLVESNDSETCVLSVTNNGLQDVLLRFLQQVWVTYCYYEAYGQFAAVTDTQQLYNTYQQFSRMDKKEQGSFDKDDLRESLGNMFGDSLPDVLFNLFDSSRAGRCSFTAFLTGMQTLTTGEHHDDKLASSFALFDSDNNKTISQKEFYHMVELMSSTIKIPLRAEESLQQFSCRVFKEMDTENTGKLTLEQYQAAIRGRPDLFLHQFWMSLQSTQSSQQDKNPISMGDPNWQRVVTILHGVKITCEAAAQAEEKTHFSAEEYKRKNKFNIPESARKRKAVKWTKGDKLSECFTDYCPQVFRAIRKRFQIEQKDYLWSLGADQLIASLVFGSIAAPTQLSSSGRSGAFFLGSHDGNFILKTIPQHESETLRRILPDYYQHIMNYANTLITRFYGLHATFFDGRKVVFVVMGNVFMNDRNKDVHISYDLKGSKIARTVPVHQRKGGVALKDMDFEYECGGISVEGTIKQPLLTQLEMDSAFLEKNSLIDYSLLLGIHNGIEKDTHLPNSQKTGEFSGFDDWGDGNNNSNDDDDSDNPLHPIDEHHTKKVTFDHGRNHEDHSHSDSQTSDASIEGDIKATTSSRGGPTSGYHHPHSHIHVHNGSGHEQQQYDDDDERHETDRPQNALQRDTTTPSPSLLLDQSTSRNEIRKMMASLPPISDVLQPNFLTRLDCDSSENSSVADTDFNMDGNMKELLGMYCPAIALTDKLLGEEMFQPEPKGTLVDVDNDGVHHLNTFSITPRRQHMHRDIHPPKLSPVALHLAEGLSSDVIPLSGVTVQEEIQAPLTAHHTMVAPTTTTVPSTQPPSSLLSMEHDSNEHMPATPPTEKKSRFRSLSKRITNTRSHSADPDHTTHSNTTTNSEGRARSASGRKRGISFKRPKKANKESEDPMSPSQATSTAFTRSARGNSMMIKYEVPPPPACYQSQFQAHFGGIAEEGGGDIYFMGIIDILTVYNARKRGEYAAKSVRYQFSKEMSCVPPTVYRDRFLQYFEKVFNKPPKQQEQQTVRFNPL